MEVVITDKLMKQLKGYKYGLRFEPDCNKSTLEMMLQTFEETGFKVRQLTNEEAINSNGNTYIAISNNLIMIVSPDFITFESPEIFKDTKFITLDTSRLRLTFNQRREIERIRNNNAELSKDVAVLQHRMLANVRFVNLEFKNNITEEKLAKYSVLGYDVDIIEDNHIYYLQNGNRGIMATSGTWELPEDSENLFADLMLGTLNLNNVDCTKVKDAVCMFWRSIIIDGINLDKTGMNNIVNARSMFEKVKMQDGKVNFGDLDTSNIIAADNIFDEAEIGTIDMRYQNFKKCKWCKDMFNKADIGVVYKPKTKDMHKNMMEEFIKAVSSKQFQLGK